MRTLNLIKILEFYDVPQLFLAADKFGAKYICMMVRFDREIGFQYLSVQISDERLDAFLSGKLDLRYLYLNPEVEDEFYILHRDSGILINWYKHAGRTNTCNKPDFTLDDFREFLIELRKNLVWNDIIKDEELKKKMWEEQYG